MRIKDTILAGRLFLQVEKYFQLHVVLQEMYGDQEGELFVA